MELVRDTEPRKDAYVVFKIKGLRGSVYVSKSMISGDAPATATIDGISFVAPGAQKEPVAKMSKEERVAALAAAREARKNETPAQKAERARVVAAKATAKAAKLTAAAGV